MVVLLVSSVSTRSRHLLAPMRQRFELLALLLKRSLTSTIYVGVLWNQVFLFWILISLPLSTMTIMLALSSHITWPLKLFVILSFVRTLFANGSRTRLFWSIAGKVNPANIFTKEMHDGVRLQWLWASFMTQLSNFLNSSLPEVHRARQRSQNTVAPLAAKVLVSTGASPYFSALSSSLFCQSVKDIAPFQCWLPPPSTFPWFCPIGPCLIPLWTLPVVFCFNSYFSSWQSTPFLLFLSGVPFGHTDGGCLACLLS